MPTIRCSGRAARAVGVPVVWFSLEPPARAGAHLAAGGRAALLADGALTLAEGSARTAVARVEEVPMTLGGAARHNVANALAAVARARCWACRSTRCAGRCSSSPGTRATTWAAPTCSSWPAYAHHRLRAQSARDGGAGGHGLGAAGPAPTRAHRPGGRPLGRGDPGARPERARACGPTGSCSRRWSAISAAGRSERFRACMADELARHGVPARRGADAGHRDRRRARRARHGLGRATCCSSPCTRIGRSVHGAGRAPAGLGLEARRPRSRSRPRAHAGTPPRRWLPTLPLASAPGSPLD